MDKGMRLLGRVGLRAHADNIRAIHRRTAATHCDCARRGLESGAVQAAEKCSREDMDMNSKQIQVIIADDHPVVIAGITRVLESLPNFKIAAAVHSVKEMFDALAQVRCDVLICDFAFDEDSEPDGLIMCEKVARRFPEVKIIVVSQHDNLARVKRIMMSGCSGFVSKSSAIQALPFAIEEVLRGAKYIDPETSKALIGSMFDAGGDRPDGQLLSAREMEVMRHYVQGMSVTQIAQRTKRSMKTISAQKQSAMKKLGAKNDVELIDIFKQIAE
ncbi:response regulator transcription factor [Candidatus Glomeribacter gigasporarum]|nr:response regulator transcription factor [Candidatus Glomeribacter gigasporarum]